MVINGVWLFRNKEEQAWMDEQEKEERKTTIEEILQEASSLGFKEAFLESFSQMVTRMLIITSTGSENCRHFYLAVSRGQTIQSIEI